MLAAPARDELRLAFADACERAGDVERAEFVRVQVELAGYGVPKVLLGAEKSGGMVISLEHVLGNLKYKDADPQTPALRARFQRIAELLKRERELLDSASGELPNRVEWFGGDPWPSHAHYGRFAPECRRGFVGSVRCSAADWLAHGDAIREREPVERVRLTTRPAWEMHPKYKDSGYARLVGREKIETVAPAGELIRRLLKAEWPGVAFELPGRQEAFDAVPDGAAALPWLG